MINQLYFWSLTSFRRSTDKVDSKAKVNEEGTVWRRSGRSYYSKNWLSDY